MSMGLFSHFVRYVSFPLINYREGIRGIYAHLRELERTQYLSADRLRDLQFQRLKQLFIHAYTNTVFYKRRFDEAGFDPTRLHSPEDIARLPVLTKEDIRVNLSEMIARNLTKNQLHSSETGGTTGVKITFYRDNACLAPKTAATIRQERWTGWEVGDRVGLVWPARQDYVGDYTFKAKLRNALSDRYITLPAAVLTDEDIYRYCLTLKKLQPTKIRCFPYALYLVAKYINEHEDLAGITPKGIIATGEPLHEHQRDVIENAFQCKVFDSYGSRETGLISQECEFHQGFHINAENVLVEFVGEDGAPVRAGETGRIVVTDFLNYGMPFIRYDLGDLGVFSEAKCRCGRGLPLMHSIQGRIVDEITVPSGRKVSSVTLVLYLVDNGPPVGQVQIVQAAIDKIIIKITKDPKPGPEIFSYYEKTTKEILGDEMKISFEVVDAIPREPSGKYRFVKSLLYALSSAI